MSTRMSKVLGLWTVLFLPLSSSPTHAEKFDERARAPQAASPIELRSLARNYANVYEQKSAVEPGGQIRDAAAHGQWLNLKWRLHRALDENKPLGDLSDLGFKRQDDGSYTVRINDHPQWADLAGSLEGLRAPSVYDAYAPELKRRGFRDQDLAALKNYLESNDPQRAAFAQNKALTESYAARVQSRHAAKLAIDPEETTYFVYRRARNYWDARRAWAVGLLDTLDKQRQRVLLSYLEEMDGTWTIGPGSDMNEQLRLTTDSLISGDYIESLRRQELEIRQ